MYESFWMSNGPMPVWMMPVGAGVAALVGDAAAAVRPSSWSTRRSTFGWLVPVVLPAAETGLVGRVRRAADRVAAGERLAARVAAGATPYGWQSSGTEPTGREYGSEL